MRPRDDHANGTPPTENHHHGRSEVNAQCDVSRYGIQARQSHKGTGFVASRCPPRCRLFVTLCSGAADGGSKITKQSRTQTTARPTRLRVSSFGERLVSLVVRLSVFAVLRIRGSLGAETTRAVRVVEVIVRAFDCPAARGATYRYLLATYKYPRTTCRFLLGACKWFFQWSGVVAVGSEGRHFRRSSAVATGGAESNRRNGEEGYLLAIATATACVIRRTAS